jgi:hypothetical protein
MLGIYGDETWTPNENHPGLWTRADIDRWAVYRWDGASENAIGTNGNFVEGATISFDDVLCGTPFGASGPC